MADSRENDPGPESGSIPEAQPKPGSGPDARAERLKAALRENLRRRKAQGRGRAGGPTPRDDGPADA